MIAKHLTFPSFGSARNDIPAGLVVFLVALPLCLGIALASGAPLFAGIIAGLVGGTVVALMSGSELSVSGPAAGLAVIVLGAIQKLGGFEIFALAVVLSGLMQIAFGMMRAGVIGDYIPNSVIKGMLAAIGVVIILKQIPHALGDDKDYVGDESFRQSDELNTFSEIQAALGAYSAGAIIISLACLTLLILWDRPFLKKFAWTALVPGPLVCVVLGTLLNELFGLWVPDWKLTAAKDHLVKLPVADSVGDFFAMFRTPSFAQILNPQVWVVAITIALVGSVETLLCIEATDKLDPQKRISDTNRELRAQGMGNLFSGLLGGLPITSVIVRSSANVYAGGRTRLSAMVHGLLLGLSVILLATWLNRVPLAALASVLLMVGYKLSSVKIIKEMWLLGRNQFIPFAVTVLAIVFTDLLKGIGIGLLVSTFFVMRANHHASITLVHEGRSWLLRFNKDMSFVNKAELKRRLRQIPNDVTLIVDGTKSLYVDRDIYETIREFETAGSFRNITLEYHNFFDKQLALS
jgi:MFS superfamily sulfate permease-like transporter